MKERKQYSRPRMVTVVQPPRPVLLACTGQNDCTEQVGYFCCSSDPLCGDC